MTSGNNDGDSESDGAQSDLKCFNGQDSQLISSYWSSHLLEWVAEEEW